MSDSSKPGELSKELEQAVDQAFAEAALQNEPLKPPEHYRPLVEHQLREAAADFRANPNAETLHEVHRQALRLLFYDPARSSEAMALLKELVPPPQK